MEDKSKKKNIQALLRSAGYHLEKNLSSGEIAFYRTFERTLFPRFHIYAKPAPEGWNLNLHLDQKQPVYEGSAAHAGEYEGKAVEKEMARIKAFLFPKSDLEIGPDWDL